MLAESLKKLLANSYSFVIKAQQFHWNVEVQISRNTTSSLGNYMMKYMQA